MKEGLSHRVDVCSASRLLCSRVDAKVVLAGVDAACWLRAARLLWLRDICRIPLAFLRMARVVVLVIG